MGCRPIGYDQHMEQYKGISYRVTRSLRGWRWTVFLGTGVRIEGRELSKDKAIRKVVSAIEDFIWKQNGIQ
jgi:hypothetical protein